jgi:hypothetical protein
VVAESEGKGRKKPRKEEKKGGRGHFKGHANQSKEFSRAQRWN